MNADLVQEAKKTIATLEIALQTAATDTIPDIVAAIGRLAIFAGLPRTWKR